MIHGHVQLEGKRNLFCILFDSYSSFKLAGIHECGSSLMLLFDMPAFHAWTIKR